MRTRSFQRYMGFENRLKNDAAVPVQNYRRGSVRWSIDPSLNASYAHFWASQLRRDDHENDHRSSRRCISKYSQSSPQVRQSSPQVRKSLVLCKEKTLRDKVGVIVIIDTRANCIAKKRAPKSWKKVLKLSSEDKAPKTWKFRHLPLYAKGATVNHCDERLPDLCFSNWRFFQVVFIPRAQPRAQSLFSISNSFWY